VQLIFVNRFFHPDHWQRARCSRIWRSSCEQRFGKTMHCATMGRLLRSMGLSRQKARPSHPRNDLASQEAFKRKPLLEVVWVIFGPSASRNKA
jgi:hypothetical protein